MRDIKGALLLLLLIIPLSWVSAQSRYLPTSNGEVVEHRYFTLSYVEQYEQAEWVYYHLTPEMVEGTTARTDDFRVDPKVSTTSAHPSDYTGSGYDRGHLCPASSMAHNREAISESFYMSNMSPQVPSFNRGGWKKLESYVRNWASGEETLHVVTGALFSDGMTTIGANKVAVPKHFYKAIYSPQRAQMIAFVMPNEAINNDIKSYAISVDSLEVVTKIDFFRSMSDSVEHTLESSIDLSAWTFEQFKRSQSATSSTTSAQCKGVTKSGSRCKNQTKNTNGYCHLHQP